jgi:hypothetical protein
MKILSIKILVRYGTARNGFLAAGIKDDLNTNPMDPHSMKQVDPKPKLASRFKDKFTSFKRLGTWSKFFKEQN